LSGRPLDFSERRRKLVESLVAEGILKTPEIIRAFLKVPREEFVPPELRDYAYDDRPLPIGYGQTISAPHMVAIMTEELSPRRGDKVLEIGTGSGYQAAILAEIVKPEGHVWTIERIRELVEFARDNLRRTGYDKYVTVIHGDGSLGLPEHAPYDRIMVTAAAPSIPENLVKQLKPGGRMVIPVGGRYYQVLKIVDKDESGNVRVSNSVPCIFVPLVGRKGFNEYEF